MTDLGYIHDVHYNCGLDVVLSIAELPVSPEIWGHRKKFKENDWANDIFTEIVIIPGPKFLDVVLSHSYHTPYHYHITLTHTFEVGHGFDYNAEKIQEWVDSYRIRERYNNKRARLGLGRWGGGYTYYIDDRSVVEGLVKPYNIFSDPDVKRVFKVPKKHKENDDLHISLLI